MIQHDIINSKCSVRLDPCYNSVKMSSLKPDDIKAALGYKFPRERLNLGFFSAHDNGNIAGSRSCIVYLVILANCNRSKTHREYYEFSLSNKLASFDLTDRVLRDIQAELSIGKNIKNIGKY